MAAPVVARSSGPALCPSFAEVCSFLERFGAVLDLPEMTFPQMERYLRDKTTVPKPLVELHVKLLRKLGRSVTTDRWEKYLAKVCQELNSTWAWELEQEGYQGMSMECKSCILKYLCECQFDDNLKFKTAINEEDPEKMRLQPIGRDQQGLMYWLQLDHEQNIRLYTEEQDDLDGSTWKCIVRTRNDLAEALELLKSQVEGKQNPDQDQNQNLCGSRSSSPTRKNEGDEAIGSTKPCRTAEERSDRETLHPVKEEEQLTQVVKLEETLPTKQANTEFEVKEEKVDSKTPPVFDNRVSTITTVIKLESRDPDAPKNAVSVVMAPGVTATKPGAIKGGEMERAVVRSSQQAKIPLKKRELKIAESYHGNHLNNSNSSNNSSSIIVCNPSVIQTKDGGKEGKLPGSLAPPGGLTTSQPPQQQPLVTASRQELSNGGALLPLPHKEGQNGVIGVIGQVGVVSHVGVIRSPSERHRAPGAEQREPNGPGLDQREPTAEQEEREVSRQSVLVRKGPVEGGAAGADAATGAPPADAADPQLAEKLPPPPSLKSDPLPEAAGRKEVSISLSPLSLCLKDPKRQTTGHLGEETTEEQSNRGTNTHSGEQNEDDGDKRTSEVSGRPLAGEGATDDHKKNDSTLGKSGADSGSTSLLLDADQLDTKDHHGDGVNGGLAAPVKEAELGSVERQGPLEEASSELQKEGIRLKIKIPPHRRNKLKGKGGKEEQKDREQEVKDDGRLLRRSARICRSSALPTCRPSSKAADSGRKKPQKKQTLLGRARGEEEEEGEEEDDDDDEEDDDEEEQSSAAKHDGKMEAVSQIRKQKGKRRHRRPRWSNIRTKRRKLTEGEEAEGRGRKGGDGQSDGGSDSEESCKSGEIPSEDACSHCGLPNHPELILLCDSCDSGYHTACLRPPVMLIPDGEWFCPPCQHKLLCEKLEEQLQNLDSALKKRERAERRRERLVYVGISVENIIPEGDQPEEEKSTKKKDPKKSKNLGRRSTRTRKNISYRFDDFDDAIDEAIEEDIRDICGGAGRGRDIAAILSEDGAKGSQRPIRSQALSARNRKRRRLNDLESDSTAAESEDEFMLSNSSEDEDFAASGPDDDEVEDEEAGSVESGSHPMRVRGLPKQRPSIKQRRGRKRPRRRRRRSSEEEEEEEEESDEEMGSDQYSDMTDSDADKKRRGLRRGQRQQVNYRETSESSDNSQASTKKVKVKGRGRPRKDHHSSDYSDASPSTRETEEDDDYEDEEEDGQRRRGNKRRREEEDLRRVRQKRRRHGGEEEEEREQGRRLKKTRPEETDKDRARRLRRVQREEEDPEKMGRGKRREILSLQRRKRLAQMLKKRRPSTDEESESSEGSETTSSSEEDRPVRKRLNRIDSDDDDEDDKEEEEEEGAGRPEKAAVKCSAVERRSDSDTQEKGRGRSLSPSNRHRTSRGPAKPGDGSPAERRDGAGSDGDGSPAERRDGAGSDGDGRHNGPSNPEEKDEVEDEGHTDSLNSAQNSPRS